MEDIVLEDWRGEPRKGGGQGDLSSSYFLGKEKINKWLWMVYKN
jgi:hypothetical protein